MSLTSPLGLTRHLRRPDLHMDMVPWLNVLALAGMLTLLNSSFIYAPGIVMDLAPPNLPSVPASELSGEPADAELTIPASVKQSQLFLLEGGGIFPAKPRDENGIVSIPGLQDALTAKRKSLRNRPAGAPAVLLLKADAGLTMEVYETVASMAQAAGFTQMVSAAKAAPGTGASLTATPNSPAPTTSGGNVSGH